MVEVNDKSQPGKVKSMERSEPHFISLNETILRDKLFVILYYALDLLDSSSGLVALWNDKDKLFIEKVSYGLKPDEINYLRPLLQEAIPNLAENKTNSGLLSQLNLQGQAETLAQIFGPVMATPLEIDNKMIGLVMVLRSNSAKLFEAGDQRLLYSYGLLLSNTVHNTLLLYQLAERQHKIDAMKEMSSDGFITIDSTRQITSFNTGMEKLVGWKKEEVIGKYCYDVLKVCDRKGVNLCQTKCPVADGFEGLCHTDGIINSKDGQKVDVTLSHSLARLPAGEIWAVLNVLDVSRLRQAKDLRSMLLAAVSHELQTPISIIKAYASILTRPDTHWDEKVFRDKLMAIEEESDRLSGMVNKLLFSSRLEVGEFSLNRLWYDLPQQAEKVAKRFSAKTTIHRIKIDFPSDFPPIFADAEKIEDVLINLIENSIKFSPRGGTIMIKGEVARNRFLVTVSDEGIGIPLRDHEYLFSLFYRVEDGPARAVKGTGLGLYICKTIIEAHGGRIWVESELGRGTRITFSMPVEGTIDTSKGKS